MNFASFVNLLILCHATLGGTALIAGAIALTTKKGSFPHKKSGKVFYYSLLLSTLFSLIVAVIPNHENPFLFSIGIFSAYLLISGYRSLKYKVNPNQLSVDKFISITMIITGILMVLFPVILYSKLNIVLAVFGVTGLLFGIRDLKLFKNKSKLKKDWLKLHLGKMIGGYISALTAFFVVNNIISGIWNWFVPGIIGGFYITYWMRKLDAKK